MISKNLSVSVVLYKTPISDLKKLIKSLPSEVYLYLIDNDDQSKEIRDLVIDKLHPKKNVLYIQNTKNRGYGSAHNVAIKKTKFKYHLVVNPDIKFEPSIINQLLNHLEKKS